MGEQANRILLAGAAVFRELFFVTQVAGVFFSLKNCSLQ